MQYKGGLVNLVNGSDKVVVTGLTAAAILANIDAGYWFNKDGEDVIYRISGTPDVSTPGDYHFHLTGTYGGTSVTGAHQVITSEFSPNEGFPVFDRGANNNAALLTEFSGLSDQSITRRNPWLIDIDVFPIATNTNWASKALDPTYYYGGSRYTSGAQNDQISWPVVLSAGTWTIEVVCFKNSANGIISLQLDGVEVGTVDTYAGSGSANNFVQVAGITVSVAGKKTLTLKMTSKNASASNYYGNIQHVRLLRTA